MNARVCIVVLNWNQPVMTGRCLDHVLRLTGVSYDVLVIDNGSTPDNRRQLAAACEGRCGLMWLPVNLGFAGGMNRGIAHALSAGCEYVWLLNNDAFPEPDCLAKLVAAMDADPRLGAVTPRLTDAAGQPRLVGTEFDPDTGAARALFEVDSAAALRPNVTLIGAALLVRAAALRRVGVFDERFFAYFEDVDLGLRLKGAGYTASVVLSAACVHDEGGTSGGGRSPVVGQLFARNQWLMLRKHTRVANGLARRLRYAGQVVQDAGQQVLIGRRSAAAGTLAGLWAAAAGRYGKPTPASRKLLTTRVILAHPFHLSNALNWLAARLEGRGWRGARA